MSKPFEDQPLGYLLSRVMFALKTDVTATVLDPLEVAFPEYLCMRVLAKYPGQSNADLARALSVSPQAMNMVLRGLEDRRLMANLTDNERYDFRRILAALGSDPI